MKTTTLIFLSSLAFCGCDSDDGFGHDHGDHSDPDHAHLNFTQNPPATVGAGETINVLWMIDTEGDLHHTDIRVCAGHVDECGLEGMDSFDASFPAMMAGTMYQASVSFETAGDWTLVAYAHVGATPHMSEAIHLRAE